MKDKLTSLKTRAEFTLMTGLAFAANPFQMIYKLATSLHRE